MPARGARLPALRPAAPILPPHMARSTAAPAKKAPAKQSAPAKAVRSAGRSTQQPKAPPKRTPPPPPILYDDAPEAEEGEVEDYDGLSEDDLHAARLGLRRTGMPGVYVNRSGNRVNRNNVLLSMLQLKAVERDHAEDVLGEPVQTPAELLRLVALDPTQPLTLRIECAKSAAPYYDRKMPIGIEGGAPERPVTVETAGILKRLNELPSDEKRMAFKLLETLGVITAAKGST